MLVINILFAPFSAQGHRTNVHKSHYKETTIRKITINYNSNSSEQSNWHQVE